MIVAAENVIRQSTQDDIILFDRSLVPPVLAANHAPEGVFLLNSVLARIEVKSTLTRASVGAFVQSSQQMAELKQSVQPGFVGPLEGTLNLLFAFDSDANGSGQPDFELTRLIEVMGEHSCETLSGIVSMICVPTRGFWKLGQEDGSRSWQRFKLSSPEDRVAWFVGCVSNTCYQAHARRQGRDPRLGLEGGIGMYLSHPFEKAV